MKYNNRTEVERIGKAGAYAYKEGNNFVARQLSSYWIYAAPGDKGFTPHARFDGFWEAWITLWFSRNIEHGSVCIDVGANAGYYTFFLATHGCKVYAFEPIPRCVELLQLGKQINHCKSNVIIEPFAVTDGKDKEVILWKASENLLNATIAKSAVATDKRFTAKTISLDKYFAKKTDIKKKISFVKIDAEGSEQKIWNGMQKLLKENPACIVLLEFYPPFYSDKGKSFIAELLQKQKISYVDFDGNEQAINSYSFFEKAQEQFWMLVLRAK